ncbi:serine/threonine protein kinase, partial [Sphaerotilus sp.]|uniref:serine/threonine protein kinase n=1 Tax=Sphaerotilus sp. TaxID=2093942 RepID=UPI0034E1FF6A
MDEDGNLSIGTRLGEFEIRGLVGAGRTGVVYRAFDHELEREVAIREYLPASLASRAEDGHVQVRGRVHAHAFGVGLQQFLRQAQLLARFDHPALVKVFRYWEGHGTAYMVMPFYAGQTLAQALRQLPAPPTEAWLMGVLVPLLGALDSLHHQHILHRHVVPDNIRLLRNGRPVLLEPDSAQENLRPGYAPIEQVAEGPDLRPGPWTDLYALAAVVHAALTGGPPPAAQTRTVQDGLEPLTAVAARLATTHGQHYHPAFLAAWQQALAIRPADRPQNVQALMQQLGLIPAPMPAGQWSEVPPDHPRDAAVPRPPATALPAAAVDPLTPLEVPKPRSHGLLAVALA